MNSETKVISIIVIITILVTILGLSLTKNSGKKRELVIDPASLIASTTPVQGNPSALVSVVEFGDFACPACSMLAPNLEAALATYQAATSSLQAKYALRLIPIHGPDSINSAVAAFAAGEQSPNKFFEMGHYLFAEQTNWTGKSESAQKELFTSYAKLINLDIAKFTATINNADFRKKVSDILTQDNADAMKMGISSTPTLVFNGKTTVIGVQPTETLKRLIESGAPQATSTSKK